jgi:hypothetical protein
VKRNNELYPFRRHLRHCKFFGPGGREIRSDKCDCPFHVDGKHYGERVRQSLKTRSRQLADRRLSALIRRLDEQRASDDSVESKSASAPRTVSEAVDRFLRNHGEIGQDRRFRGDVEYGTWRKYRTKLRLLASFCEGEGISELADVNIDILEDFRRTREIGLVTWKVELQALRTFFGYCVSHRWMTTNRGGSLHFARRGPDPGGLRSNRRGNLQAHRSSL